MEVALGLVSAFFWGITDFLGGPAARRVGVRHAVFVSNALGLLVLIVVLVFAVEARHKLFDAHAKGLLTALAAAALLLAATLTLSTALRSGKAAIVAPIAMSYGVVTTLLSICTGEHLRGAQLIGIAICMIGVPLTGITSESPPAGSASKPSKAASDQRPATHSPLLSVVLASCAMVCFGASYWIQGRFAIGAVGTAGTLFINYGFATFVLGFGLLCFRKRGGEPPAIRYPIVLAQATCSLLALGTFSVGLTTGHTSTLAVLSTLSGAVTAILGFMFRGERLNRIQWAGVATVVVGAMVVRW